MSRHLLIVLGALLLSPVTHAADDLQAFQAAPPGLVRHVIRLPEQPEPDNLRVEIIAGRSIEADCNVRQFAADISEETVPGWGYPYYRISPLSGPLSTRMACPPGEAAQRRFVPALLGPAAMLRYNPRLPLVIYTAPDVELKYRIWRAGELQSVN